MKLETLKYVNEQWVIEENILDKKTINIVFTFGDRESVKNSKIFNELKVLYPNADIVGCSSSGNILG